MSALAGLGIDNLHVDIAGPEIPIMDGSAGAVRVPAAVGGHRRAGRAQALLRILAPVEVKDGDKWARFDPFNGFKLDFTIDFPHPVFGSENRHVVIDFAEHSYVKEVARARTFGFMQDVEAMRAAGLALGGSLQNAIVLDEFRVLNTEGLRYDNEFVKHKVLDAIGDLYLLGHPLIGQYTAFKSGHGAQQRARPRAARRVRTPSSSITFAEGRRRAVGVPGLAARAGVSRDPRPAAVLPGRRRHRGGRAALPLHARTGATCASSAR